ncbi:MAG: bis(5'-nucleosyl)-tetraphosphatase (symmetrical) YqeK [Brevinema sp.]
MINKYISFFADPCPADPVSLKQASIYLLSPQRFAHVEGVHKKALKFAEMFGLSPEETLRLETAVWFHDFVKGLSSAEQLNLATELHIPMPKDAAQAAAITYHCVIDAWIIPNIFKVSDHSLENAVRHHTTGHHSLDLVGQLLFLADYCEDGREYDSSHVEELLPKRLNDALLTVVSEKLIQVLKKGSYLHPEGIHYYHFLRAKVGVPR